MDIVRDHRALIIKHHAALLTFWLIKMMAMSSRAVNSLNLASITRTLVLRTLKINWRHVSELNLRTLKSIGGICVRHLSEASLSAQSCTH